MNSALSQTSHKPIKQIIYQREQYRCRLENTNDIYGYSWPVVSPEAYYTHCLSSSNNLTPPDASCPWDRDSYDVDCPNNI